MEKFFRKIDSLPIVKLLQASAGIVFMIQFLVLMASFFPILIKEPSGILDVLQALWGSISIISQIFCEPLILLGLAEAIKRKSLGF
jgi:hypothetical protein